MLKAKEADGNDLCHVQGLALGPALLHRGGVAPEDSAGIVHLSEAVIREILRLQCMLVGSRGGEGRNRPCCRGKGAARIGAAPGLAPLRALRQLCHGCGGRTVVGGRVLGRGTAQGWVPTAPGLGPCWLRWREGSAYRGDVRQLGGPSMVPATKPGSAVDFENAMASSCKRLTTFRMTRLRRSLHS